MPPENRHLLFSIAAVLLAYAGAVLAGLPQQGTAALVRQAELEQREAGQAVAQPGAGIPKGDSPIFVERKLGQSPRHFAAAERRNTDEHPPYWTVVPFVLLLGAIAVFPLVPGVAHWWDSNLHRFYAAALLAAATLAYYLFWHPYPLHAEWPVPHLTPPSAGGLNLAHARDVLAGAILGQYVPFILLLFSLYTISGGIRLVGDLPAHPATNSIFLAAGAVLASIIGTTGAAMVLVRPLLDTNSERRHVAHTVVFFIFVVCNCGGCLLPTGDPPLFLGYLMGVGFFWTLRLWPEWLFVNGMLIAIYFLYDRFWCYPHERREDVARDETQVRPLRVFGLWPNALLLVAVIASVAILDPASTLPGTEWHPWMYLREAVLLGLVGAVAAAGQRGGPPGEPVQLRGHPRGRRAVLRHLYLYAAAATDPQHPRAGPRPRDPNAFLLEHRRAFVGARQRPDLRGILRDGPDAHRRACPACRPTRCWRR